MTHTSPFLFYDIEVFSTEVRKILANHRYKGKTFIYFQNNVKQWNILQKLKNCADIFANADPTYADADFLIGKNRGCGSNANIAYADANTGKCISTGLELSAIKPQYH